MRWVHSFHRYASLHTRFLLVNVYDRLITVWMELEGEDDRMGLWGLYYFIDSLDSKFRSSTPYLSTVSGYLPGFCGTMTAFAPSVTPHLLLAGTDCCQ